MSSPTKLIVQCDFDGTVTEQDISFLILDAFAEGDWRKIHDEYMTGKISVGTFNSRAFAMVKADKKTLLDYIAREEKARIRPGFSALLNYCHRAGIDFVIVSNGVDFYVEAILHSLKANGTPFHAARSRFTANGMHVEYIGPDGKPIEDGFKEAYTRHFLEQGYRVIYIGNGISDIYPSRKAQYVFATADLLERCRETNLACTPFKDLNDVVKGLENLSLA